MKQVSRRKQLVLAVLLVLPSLIYSSANAQDTLRLNLENVLEIALSESPTIQIANQEIEKKAFAKKGSYAALFPQVNFATDYSRAIKKQVMYMDMDLGGAEVPGMDPNSMKDGIEVGRDNNWTTGFTASMPLINASLWKSLHISAVDVELAVEKARSSKIDLVNQVRKAFYAVLLANDSYRVFQESHSNNVQNYLDVKKKFDQGVVAEYDLIRADVTVQNSEPTMLQALNSLALAKWQLKALMGMDLEIPIHCDGQLTDYERELYGDHLATDTSLIDNSNLKQLELQGKQLQKTLSMQKADFLPTLSMTGLYQWNSMNNNFKFGEYRWNAYSMVGLSLSIPIFTGGSRHYKVKQTEVSINQLKLQQDDAERNLRLAVKRYKDEMDTAIKQFGAAQKGIEQAKRGYLIAQKRYDTGAGTLLELNDSELALTQSKLNFNQMIYNYVAAKSELEQVLGKQAN